MAGTMGLLILTPNNTDLSLQSINIRLLRHDKMQANKLKDKHDKTRKRGNYECIATWGLPSHASPFPL